MRVAFALLALTLIAVPATAGFVVAPVSATTNMGGSGRLNKMFDQSGLSTPYTPGVTDFDVFTATARHNGGASSANNWVSDDRVRIGTIDFVFAAPIDLIAFAVWNNGPFQGIKDFTLTGSDGPLFTSPVPLGSYTAASTEGPAQVFPFDRVTVTHVRLTVTSVQGNSIVTSIGEVAFQQAPTASPVPAPPAAALFAGIAACGMLVRRRRAVNGRNPTT